MAVLSEEELEPSKMPVRTSSDQLQKRILSDTLSQGLVTKATQDTYSKDQTAALRDRWNHFLLEGREVAFKSANTAIQCLHR